MYFKTSLLIFIFPVISIAQGNLLDNKSAFSVDVSGTSSAYSRNAVETIGLLGASIYFRNNVQIGADFFSNRSRSGYGARFEYNYKEKSTFFYPTLNFGFTSINDKVASITFKNFKGGIFGNLRLLDYAVMKLELFGGYEVLYEIDAPVYKYYGWYRQVEQETNIFHVPSLGFQFGTVFNRVAVTVFSAVGLYNERSLFSLSCSLCLISADK